MEGPVCQRLDRRTCVGMRLRGHKHGLIQLCLALGETRVRRLSPRWKNQIAITELQLGFYESKRRFR